MIKLIDYWRYRKYKDVKFNLLLIGAQKCGTTSLYQMLNEHPQIFFTEFVKEPGYFLPFDVMSNYFEHKGIKIKSKNHFFKLLLRGYKGESYFGDASTFYSTAEWGTLRFVHSLFSYNSEMKFIYIVRRPMDRVISHYKHELKKNHGLSVDSFLNNEEVFGVSSYISRLDPYIKVFGLSSVLILEFENLVNGFQEEMNKVSSFLDLENHISKKLQKSNEGIKLSKSTEVELRLKIKKNHLYKNTLEEYDAILKMSKSI